MRRRQDEGQGTGPKRRREPARAIRELAHAEIDRVGVADDQWEGHLFRTPLGFENAIEGCRVARQRTQPVEGLRGIGNEETLAEYFGGPRQQFALRMMGVDLLHTSHRLSFRVLIPWLTITQFARHGDESRDDESRPEQGAEAD